MRVPVLSKQKHRIFALIAILLGLMQRTPISFSRAELTHARTQTHIHARTPVSARRVSKIGKHSWVTYETVCPTTSASGSSGDNV